MIYDGGTYRISIAGEDSSLILNSSTNTIRANLIDNNNQTVFDLQKTEFRGNFVGNLLGNIVDSYGTPLYNSKTRSLKANLEGVDGNVAYRSDKNEFYGNFIGSFSGNIVDEQDNIIYDAAQRELFASLRSHNGDPAYDAVTNTIVCNVAGTIVSSITTNINNAAGTKTLVDTASEAIKANIVADNNEIIVNVKNNKIVASNVHAHSITLDGKISKHPKAGTIVFNKDSKKFQGYTGTEWVNLH
jgi:hypothetical protein